MSLLITKGNTTAAAPSQQELTPKALKMDAAHASPGAALNEVRNGENQQNMMNNMHGGWIPMGSNAYNIDEVNAAVNTNGNHNTSVARRRMRRRERRNLRNQYNGPRPHPHPHPRPYGNTYRGTIKGFGGGKRRATIRRGRSAQFTRSRRYRKLTAFQRRVSRRVQLNMLHRKIRKSKNNYTQRRNQRRSEQLQQQGGEPVTVPQAGVSCAGGAAQQNCPGNTSASLLEASRQATANAQGDHVV